MKKLEVLLFIAGSVLFGILLHQFGFARLVDNIRRAGGWIAVVFALQLPIYALNTQTWRVILGDDRRHFSWFETLGSTVSAFALNYITPVITLGGEPYRAYVLTRRLDARTSVSSVVLFRLLHTLAHLLTWVIALGLAFVLVPRSPSVVASLILTGVVLVGLVALLFSGPQNGLVSRLFGAIQRARFLGPVARGVSAKQAAVERVNEIIVDFYRRRRGALFLGIGLELAARVLSSLEIYIILRGGGIAIDPLLSFYIYAAASLFTNIVFFVPFELGIKESGLYVVLMSLGLAPELGVFIGVVGRIREFLWIFLGLVFLLRRGERGWSLPRASAEERAWVKEHQGYLAGGGKREGWRAMEIEGRPKRSTER